MSTVPARLLTHPPISSPIHMPACTPRARICVHACAHACRGSKWYEVMPGKWSHIVPDLETLITTGKEQGAWPAARDEWGVCASKLETVLLVEIPAEEYRSADRIVPERNDVYIIPQSSCVEGKLLDDSDAGHYYSNMNIKACLLLKPPDDEATQDGQRVCCTPAYGKHGATTNVQMTAISTNARVSDKLDRNVFPPRVISYTASIAKPIQADTVALHRMIERDLGGKKHWLENVARFKPAEMAAGLEAINKALLHAYTIAYVFASQDEAEKACSNMGLIATKNSGNMFTLTVSLRSPADLGWEKNAGGRFRGNVSKLMGMIRNDVQTVIVCAIPTQAIPAVELAESDTFTISEHVDNLRLFIPLPLFRITDVGRTVCIRGETVNIDGSSQTIEWGGAKHHDCTGIIKSVEVKQNGRVLLKDGQVCKP